MGESFGCNGGERRNKGHVLYLSKKLKKDNVIVFYIKEFRIFTFARVVQNNQLNHRPI